MTDKEKLLKLRKLADAMYYAAQHLTTDASRLHKAMDEYHKFVTHGYIEEEPVSEDLEVASMQYGEELDNILAVGVEDDNSVGEYAQEAFKAGSNWQNEQMLSKAVDVTIAIPYPNGDGGYIQLVYCKEALPFGENIKVLVIKED